MKEPLRMKCLRMYLFMIPGERHQSQSLVYLDVDEDFLAQQGTGEAV